MSRWCPSAAGSDPGQSTTSGACRRGCSATTTLVPLLVLALPTLVALVELLPPVLGALAARVRADAVVTPGVDLVVRLHPVVLEAEPPVHEFLFPRAGSLDAFLPRSRAPDRDRGGGSVAGGDSGSSSTGAARSSRSAPPPRSGRSAPCCPRRSSRPAPGNAPNRPCT